jgi:eukaryotic-like serine/threonine-protein kinase
MSQPADRPGADRNLLFGILALQMGFLGRDALVSAMHAWVLDKQKPLGQILLEQRQLTGEQLRALDALIVQHLKAHGDNAERSLQALTGISTIAVLLNPVADADVRNTLANLQSRTLPEEGGDGAVLRSDRPRFQVLHFHRSGGLGLVSVADDTELHREVALKEIKPEYADDPGCRCRFVLEAEITGGLEHPGIVPVYGLGAYANGRPYYAMRFIRGDTLKEAIELFHDGSQPGERSLAFRQLLRRFIDVCNAIAYAHSRGVLHRDLKPGNVILGRFGETLVLDWGLAKAGVRPEKPAQAPPEGTRDPTLRPSSGTDLVATQAGAGLLGTIGFMSPEQAAQQFDKLTFTSDIYSLGSTLYVLLTGRRPYEGASHEEVLAQNRRGEFAPPRQVKPDTPPALDAICRKAMSLRPSDRYPTALDLAADIEHWLGDEPVAAYPEPWTARAGRWGRRHRSVVVGVGVFLLSAVVALSFSTALVSAEQRRTAEQKQLAVENYKISRDQSFNIIKLIETSEPEFATVPALHDRRQELLGTAAAACRQFLQQEPDDLELMARSARIYRFAANFSRLVNETQQADPLYRDAIGLYERLLEAFPNDPGHRFHLAEILRDYASSQVRQGRLAEATANLNQSLQGAEGLRREDPQQPAYRRCVALALLNLASIEYRQGKHEQSNETEKTLQRSVDLLRDLAAQPPEQRHPYEPLLLAAALNRSAMIMREAGRLEEANTAHKEAIKQLTGMQEKKASAINAADVVHFLAECRVEQSKTWAKNPAFLESAEKNMGVAINRLAELAVEYKRIPAFQEALGAALNERGQLRLQQRNYPGAREHFKSAQERLAPLVQAHDNLPELRGELGKSYAGLGQVALALKDDDPEPWFQKAAGELREAVARSPEDAQLQRSRDALPKSAR